MKVALVMGSDSDLPVLRPCIDVIKAFDIELEARVISAHRTPDEALDFAKTAEEKGIEIIIAAAGKAAHLAGVLAAHTVLPVIGIPVNSSTLDGMDSLLSTVQMPAGVPVATVGINASENAGLLAAQMLSLKYPLLKEKLQYHKKVMAESVSIKDKKLQSELQTI